MSPAVAAHALRLGVLLCFATATCWLFDRLVFLVCEQLSEECDSVGEALDLAGHGIDFFCFGVAAVAKIGG